MKLFAEMLPEILKAFLPISLAYKKILCKEMKLTKYSETSPCFLFAFQSLVGMILKCLNTSTKGCCHRDPVTVALALVLPSVCKIDVPPIILVGF